MSVTREGATEILFRHTGLAFKQRVRADIIA